MTRTTLVRTVLLMALLFVAGCPLLSINEITIKPGSLGDGGFTLVAQVDVKIEPEKCEPQSDGEIPEEWCEPGAEVIHGQGLVGVWLPEGWQTEKARLIGPQSSEPEVLEVLPEAAPAFPDTFP